MNTIEKTNDSAQTETATPGNEAGGTTSEIIAEQAEGGAQENKSIEVSELEKEVESNIPPFTPEAWEWVRSASIPGAWPPINYSGYNGPKSVAIALGRPMELVEAKHMVQPDGQPVRCAITGEYFQPIKNLIQVPGNLREQLTSSGKFLMDLDLRFCGGYYLRDSDLELLALSGPLFAFHGGRYLYDRKSPLGMMAITMGKMGQNLKLGYHHAEALEIQKKRTEGRTKARDFRNAVGSIAQQVVGKRRN